MKLRQSPRLKAFEYAGPFAYNLGFVTRGRLPVFTSADIVESCLHALEAACLRYGFDTLAYCFMPDHLHVLLVGGDGSPLKDFVRHFKQGSGYAFKQRHAAHLWQVSYYDHVVRRQESLAQIAAYIWDNPVRASLVQTSMDYPFSGPRELMEQA